MGVPEILKGVEQLLTTLRECSASGTWRANDIAVFPRVIIGQVEQEYMYQMGVKNENEADMTATDFKTDFLHLPLLMRL